MKVLHINSYYNGSIFYKKLYDKQINNGLDIDVFVPVSYSYKRTGVDLGRYTTISADYSKVDRLLFHLKHHKIYKDVVKRYEINDYSIVHAHSLFSNGYIAMRLKQKYGVPYIVTVRNTDVNTFFKYMIHLRRLGVQILENAGRIIFLSKSYRDNVIEKYVPLNLQEEIYNKSSIIPNGIDDFWFRNKGSVRNISNKNNLRLLHVGVVNKNKNIITTIKAIEILKQEGCNVEFSIVGRIEDESIYNQIKDLSYINYVSTKSKEELLQIYRTNEICVMPSIYESFGLVYAEALSQGLPVIYTRGQGFDGQFEDGEVGYSVLHDSPKEICIAIEKIINQYSNISGRCLKSSERFVWDKIVNEYWNIYLGIS